MKRLVILTGHYGSGKSEIAVNMAIDEKMDMLVDLDIVNPYFRSRSVRSLLESHNVTLVESTLENASGSDLPFISSKGSRPFYDESLRAVFDLAGTKSGAKILKQYDQFINPEAIEFLMVVNIFRMETADANKIIHLIAELEGSAQLKVTGLINNTNLMKETTEATIIEGERVLKEVSSKLNIPIVYTFIEASIKTQYPFAGEVRRLTRHLAKKWL